MTYEEILESHTPHSSRKNKSAGLAAPTPDNTTAQPSTLNKSPKKMTAKLPPQVLSGLQFAINFTREINGLKI